MVLLLSGWAGGCELGKAAVQVKCRHRPPGSYNATPGSASSKCSYFLRFENSGRHVPAIDRDGVARNERSIIRAQEIDGGSNLVRPGVPA
jgi:hypothetical protein